MNTKITEGLNWYKNIFKIKYENIFLKTYDEFNFISEQVENYLIPIPRNQTSIFSIEFKKYLETEIHNSSMEYTIDKNYFVIPSLYYSFDLNICIVSYAILQNFSEEKQFIFKSYNIF